MRYACPTKCPYVYKYKIHKYEEDLARSSPLACAKIMDKTLVISRNSSLRDVVCCRVSDSLLIRERTRG